MSDIKKIKNNLKKKIKKAGALSSVENKNKIYSPINSPAKQLIQDRDKLQKIFRNANQREIDNEIIKEKEFESVIKPLKNVEKVVPDAKQLIQDRNKLQKIFGNANQREIDNEIIKEKEFEPVIKALKDVEKAVNKTDEDLQNALVPIKTSKEQPRALKDTTFGIWEYNDKKTDKKTLVIGKNAIQIIDNDIILNKKRYTGTEGLWNLLTESNLWDENNKIIVPYTNEDLKTYKEILIETDSIYQKNDKKTGKPKSSGSNKYNILIKDIWNEIKRPSEHVGEGLKYYTENPIEHVYINNILDLLSQLHYIAAEEKAGNINFHNEKLSILNFVNNTMKKLLDTPKGTEYLIDFVRCIPKKIIKGTGHVINSKFMSEIHWPGYKTVLKPDPFLNEKSATNLMKTKETNRILGMSLI